MSVTPGDCVDPPQWRARMIPCMDEHPAHVEAMGTVLTCPACQHYLYAFVEAFAQDWKAQLDRRGMWSGL